MKKLVSILLVLILTLACLPLAIAESSNGVVKVSAISDMGIYHQIVALILEYPEEVVVPETDAYTLIDFAPARMKEDYDQRDFARGVITAVYTNDAAERRDDQTSVPGKYVVLELAPVSGSYFDEEDGIQKPDNLFGLCTWRVQGEKSEHFRKDFSEIQIAQKADIKNAEGKVIAKAGMLPELQEENIRHLKLERFDITSIKSTKGNDIHYSIALPENYDTAKKYPMVVSVSGTGGRLNYMQQDAEGNFECIGGDIGRDSAAAAWLDAGEDVIIVSPQMWNNQPEEWGVDIIEDTLYLLDYIIDNYAVDTDRIYGIGSSFGTGHLSGVITARPGLFAAYAQCNGGWAIKGGDGTPNQRLCIYKPEYAGRVNGWSCSDALSLPLRADCLKDKAEYWDDAVASLQDVVNNRMPVFIWQGINDQSGPWPIGLSTYYLLRALYEEQGLSQAEIDKLVILYFAEDAEYFEKGICEIHATSKLAVSYPWFLDWMLAQHK